MDSTTVIAMTRTYEDAIPGSSILMAKHLLSLHKKQTFAHHPPPDENEPLSILYAQYQICVIWATQFNESVNQWDNWYTKQKELLK